MVYARPRRSPMGSRRRTALLAARSPLPVHRARLVPTHVSDTGGSRGRARAHRVRRGFRPRTRLAQWDAAGRARGWIHAIRVRCHACARRRPTERARARGRQQLEHEDDARRPSGNRTDGTRLSLVGLRRHRPAGHARRLAGRLRPEAARHGRLPISPPAPPAIEATMWVRNTTTRPAISRLRLTLVRLDGDREVPLTVPAATLGEPAPRRAGATMPMTLRATLPREGVRLWGLDHPDTLSSPRPS